MNDKKKNTILIFGILILLAAIAAVSYALWTITKIQSNPNEVMTGCFNITYTNESESINLTNAFPMTEEDGLRTRPYTFSIENTCSVTAAYMIGIEVLENNTLSESYVRASLNRTSPVIIGNLQKTNSIIQNATAYQLDSDELKAGEKITHRLNIWMDKNTPQTEENKIISAKITVSAMAADAKYVDNSGAENPDLKNGLIPVLYDEQKQSWVKADLYEKWYDYDNQWWANAVTIKAANRSTYASAEAGTEIPMDAINTMWVWVPRYEYQTDNLGTASARKYAGGTQTEPGAININFVSQDTTTASASNFLIHPAFTFGIQQLPGIWVAKFEMSPAAGTTCATTSNKTNCDITAFAPEIKPSVLSWRNARVGTFFTAIQNQMNGSNGTATYGLTNSDTHLMKNMEWGATAYLSQSKYGKYGNTTYTGTDKEVAINNCRITGIGGDTVSAGGSATTCTTNTYETAKGQAASTTGNIYGIYDMSGGNFEYVMGVMKESTNTEVSVGKDESYNSGFSGKLYDGTDYTGTYGYLKDIDTKYYDVYDYGTSFNGTSYSDYARGHQGDGTTEVVGWYQDYAYFVYSSIPWFLRAGGGDAYGIYTGVFIFLPGIGDANGGYSGRPVLVSAAS